MVAKTSNLHIHFTRQGEGEPVILLHGLFGSGGNLGALARSLSTQEYTVYCLDLPNHGRSDWMVGADLATLAQALTDWMAQQGIGRAALVGHSLGGKVAMELALAQPDAVAALLVADIAPVTYPPHHDAVFAALEAVVDAGCHSRAEAAELMANYLDEEGVIQFLLMSLKRDESGCYSWRFNLQGIKNDYAAVRAKPDPGEAYTGPVMFVKGGDSDYILPQHREVVLSLFPAAQMKVMPGCGHWLHAQQPELFNGIVKRFLAASYSGRK